MYEMYYLGWIEIIIGSMFSGKFEEFICCLRCGIYVK